MSQFLFGVLKSQSDRENAVALIAHDGVVSMIYFQSDTYRLFNYDSVEGAANIAALSIGYCSQDMTVEKMSSAGEICTRLKKELHPSNHRSITKAIAEVLTEVADVIDDDKSVGEFNRLLDSVNDEHDDKGLDDELSTRDLHPKWGMF